MVQLLAAQVGVDTALFAQYAWEGRTIEAHHAQIREITRIREFHRADEEALLDWLCTEIFHHEHHPERHRELIRVECRTRGIEAPDDIAALIETGLMAYEAQIYTVIMARLAPPVQDRLDALLVAEPEASREGEEGLPLSLLRQDPGPVGVESALSEIAKLHSLRAIGLPPDLFQVSRPTYFWLFLAFGEALVNWGKPATLCSHLLRRGGKDANDSAVSPSRGARNYFHKRGSRGSLGAGDLTESNIGMPLLCDAFRGHPQLLPEKAAGSALCRTADPAEAFREKVFLSRVRVPAQNLCGTTPRLDCGLVPAHPAAALPQGVVVTRANMLINQRYEGHIKFGDVGRGISPYPYFFAMGQDRTEQLLLQHFTEAGGMVRWGTTLGDLSPTDEGVRVELHAASGQRETIRARYVCGCDGASSQERHALGIGFPGATYVQRFFVTDVQDTALQVEGEISVSIGEEHFYGIFPMPGKNHYRIVAFIPPDLLDKHDLTFEDVRPDVERYTNIRVTDTFWFSTYDSHHRVAERFRREQVFLLGDAAHIHSPAGGQGMNTGLMDATNLGWKLAAVLKEEADERLLASYEPERMAFARQLVATTDRVFTVVTSPRPAVRVFRSVIAPTLIPVLSQFPQMRRLFFSLISQTRVNNREMPISRGAAGRVRAGDRLPWVQWSGGGSNYDALRTLRPHLQVYGTVSPEVESTIASPRTSATL